MDPFHRHSIRMRVHGCEVDTSRLYEIVIARSTTATGYRIDVEGPESIESPLNDGVSYNAIDNLVEKSQY